MRRLFFIIALMLVACAATPPRQGLGGLNPKLYKVYEAWHEDTGHECDAPKFCGDVVSINCNAETDGPYMYYDNKSSELLMACGGYCMSVDESNPKSCKSCPPKEWKCVSDYH